MVAEIEFLLHNVQCTENLARRLPLGKGHLSFP
jgi:hypothetical protein